MIIGGMMKVADVVVFKSPTRIDWGKTLKNIIHEVMKEFPHEDIDTQAEMSLAAYNEIRTVIRKIGTKRYRDIYVKEVSND